jgi:integrase
MRAGEAVRLQCQDVDVDSGEIVIHNSKGWKQRVIPLSPSTVNALRAYIIFRDSINSLGQVTSFFQLDNERALNLRSAEHAFKRLRETAELSVKFNGRYPRLYDFRHTFVCRRVLNWYQSNDDIDCHVVQLSRYIGHKKVSNTYWYLTATPALMACATKRFCTEFSGEPLYHCGLKQ